MTTNEGVIDVYDQNGDGVEAPDKMWSITVNSIYGLKPKPHHYKPQQKPQKQQLQKTATAKNRNMGRVEVLCKNRT